MRALLTGLSVLTSMTAGSVNAQAAESGVVVVSGAGAITSLTEEQLARLSAVTLIVSTGLDQHQVSFEGPLLWTLLDQAKAVNAERPGEMLRQTVTVVGHDGFTAVLALAEIAPEFEGKQVVLADRVDGQALDPGHAHLIVPGDQRKGRSVRDVARITVSTIERGQP